jgi:hypothetical protein
MRIDHREMQDELAAAHDESERSGRRLDEVVLEFLYRGDSVRVAVGESAWTGVVVHAGAEVMVLGTPGGVEVDVAYEALTSIRVMQRARSGGRPLVAMHPATMLARLRELANSAEDVEIGGPRLQPHLRGRVEIVARTHVEFRSADGAEWVLPVGEIGYLIRQASSDPR